jgi:hypothetical protein
VKMFWVAPAHRGERGDFGDFFTSHSNGTNEVIDTRSTFCYSFPCLPLTSPALLPLSLFLFLSLPQQLFSLQIVTHSFL